MSSKLLYETCVITIVIRMPHKEKRKIIKIGETSLAVILPKAWFRYFNLKHGDFVEVISNSEVIIRPKKLPLGNTTCSKGGSN